MAALDASMREAQPADRRRFMLSSFQRKLVLTTHIIVSVGLLGDSAGYLAVAIRAASAEGRLIAGAAYEVVALSAATALGVFKPGKRWSSSRSERDRSAPGAADTPAAPIG